MEETDRLELKAGGLLFSIPGNRLSPDRYRTGGAFSEGAFSEGDFSEGAGFCDVSAFCAGNTCRGPEDTNVFFGEAVARADRDGDYINVVFRDGFLAENVIRLAEKAERYGEAFPSSWKDVPGAAPFQGKGFDPDSPEDLPYFYTLGRGFSKGGTENAGGEKLEKAFRENRALRCAAVMMLFHTAALREAADAGVRLRKSDFSAKLPEILRTGETRGRVPADVSETMYRAAAAFLLTQAEQAHKGAENDF